MKISGKSLDKSNSKIIEELRPISKRVAIKDPTIWGENTQASFRLNWVDLPKNSRDLLPQLDALSAWARSRNLHFMWHGWFLTSPASNYSYLPKNVNDY